MIKKYLASARHTAAQFTAGMSATDAEAMCFEFNAGRDVTSSDVCFYNGTVIFIIRPGTTPLTVNPGNWIVEMPDGSLDVHADADFCGRFCLAAT
jgi:hypothetical protein